MAMDPRPCSFPAIPTLSDPSSSSSSSDSSPLRHRSTCRSDESMHGSEERTPAGYGALMADDDATSGCTEEERVAVEQLRELRRRIRKFSPQTGHSSEGDAIEDGDDADREPANKDSNSEPGTGWQEEPCSSSIGSVELHHMYNPRWRKLTQYKCGSYVVSRASSRNKLDHKNKGELGSMVESPLEKRKYGVQVCKNAIINDSSHGMISSSNAHTHKRTDQPTYHHHHQHQHQHQHQHHHHHHHHQEGDADSIAIDSADIDFIDVARPRKKTRLLTDIYQQIQSKPTGAVHGDLANAHHQAASVIIDRKRKVVHMKGRRRSLNGIMGERDR